MARRIYQFDTPDRFVAGAVGPPGERTFFLQARGDGAVITVELEKVQVAALAERLALLVAEIRRRGVAVAGPGELLASEPPGLEEPIRPAFRAATLTMSWDGTSPAVTVEAYALGADESESEGPRDWEDDDPAAPDLLRVRLAASEAEAFARRAEQLVAAGRPLCPMCGQPLDPRGHLCPRRNGHAAHLN